MSTESVPGNLHVSSNTSIEHLIKRCGAVNLIRQLATDLAQREAEMMVAQRRNSQRESVMMKLLAEVGFSSAQVEGIIRERTNAEARDDEQYLKDLLSDAMEEGLDHDHLTRPKASSVVTSLVPSSRHSNTRTLVSGDGDDGDDAAYTTLTPGMTKRPHSQSSPPVPHSSSTQGAGAPSVESHYDIFQGSILNVVSHKFLNHVPQPVHDAIVNTNTSTGTNRLIPLEMENFNAKSKMPTEEEGYVDQFGFLYDKEKSMASASSTRHSVSTTELLQHHQVETSPLQSKLLSLADNYDKNKKHGSIQWDEFIKKITLLDDDNHDDLLVIKGESITHYKHLYNELSRLVRQFGIPMSLRPKIWSELCGAKSLRNPTEYYTLLHDESLVNAEAESQIELDLYRTMPYNVFFKDNGPGLDKLQNVLIAFSRKYPHVGYCQGMNFLVGNLLLVYHNDEDVFWTFVGLFENVLPNGFFNLASIKSDLKLVKQNFKEQLPKLNSHFRLFNVELEPICFNWIMSLFTDSLSAHLVFRIWDSLMLNGYTEIYKTVIALFRIFEDKLMLLRENVAIYEFMKNLNKSNFNLRSSDLVRMSATVRISEQC